MQLDEVDMKVLGLVDDDYYGLWEVSDYFVQLMPDVDPEAARAMSRTRIVEYLVNGLIDVFVGTMTNSDFERVDFDTAKRLLATEDLWATPQHVGPVVAVYCNDESQKRLGLIL